MSVVQYLFLENSQEGIPLTLIPSDFLVKTIVYPQLASTVNPLLGTDKITIKNLDNSLNTITFERSFPSSRYELLNTIVGKVNDNLRLADYGGSVLNVFKSGFGWFFKNTHPTAAITLQLSENMSVLVTGKKTNTTIIIPAAGNFGPFNPDIYLGATMFIDNMVVPINGEFGSNVLYNLSTPTNQPLKPRIKMRVFYSRFGADEELVFPFQSSVTFS